MHPEEVARRGVGGAGKLAVERPIEEESLPEHLRDREDELDVGDVGKDLPHHALGPEEGALLGARRAEPPGLTGDADGNPDIVVKEPDGIFRIHWNRVDSPIVRGEHTDLDSDGRIDDCQGIRFHRGDVTSDLQVDISDSIALLRRLFQGDPPPACLEAADIDDDGSIDVTDAIFILVYLFQGGAPPAHPGPDDPCAADVDADGIECMAYPGCR